MTTSINFFKSRGTVYNLPTSKSSTLTFKLLKVVKTLTSSAMSNFVNFRKFQNPVLDSVYYHLSCISFYNLVMSFHFYWSFWIFSSHSMVHFDSFGSMIYFFERYLYFGFPEYLLRKFHYFHD